MALIANVDLQFLSSAACHEFVPTATRYLGLEILGVDAFFHRPGLYNLFVRWNLDLFIFNLDLAAEIGSVTAKYRESTSILCPWPGSKAATASADDPLPKPTRTAHSGARDDGQGRSTRSLFRMSCTVGKATIERMTRTPKPIPTISAIFQLLTTATAMPPPDSKRNTSLANKVIC